jgi:DNA-binding winged helix-turn-helix (wHTH) protein
LRTALGVERELIHTVAGRGYQFTGEVRILPASPDERAGAGEFASEGTRSAGRGRAISPRLTRPNSHPINATVI